MLSDADLVAFIPTRDLAAAKVFYGTVLGLRLVDENDFAVVYDANGTRLRVTRVEQLHTAPCTPSGTRIAWFTDPDGNTLSLEQSPA
jgi:predicted enzyme related to lactoylglutathione lyase